ncbi:MAG TPA: electron transport complex subunit RsxC [Tenuifilaceae bacterium]|nr:electron transport complex subunit RsxC [Tenuifilaceae bacterium]HPI44989.1 electron transport complex subunit RsxC [Tenuifilaceae bacterium]HPN23099.1 electron transport complex subunit RsxC [Tenuifilaceae bacterium]
MLKTFSKGGVHPPENKISAGKSIEILPLPQKVSIPVSQHIGAPANVLVAKGDKVKVGQVIAQSSGFVSANIHSSVSGTVESIDAVLDSSGYKRQAITITVEDDEWIESIDRSTELKKDIQLNAQDIIKRINESGIVGLGGATFPSHVKLSVPAGKKAEVLIINGVECEPYLTSDHRLMLEKGHEMMVGIQILMRALNVEKALIGIENNKPDAIKYLKSIAGEYKGVEVHGLKVKYPQGGEKQLIKALINREVPSGGLPIDIGAVVHNVGTAFAVYEAVQKNKPLFERVVTVTGKNLPKTANYIVRIGTSVAELIAAAGGLPDDTGKVVNGGPMMGKALTSTDVPVTKGTSGIIVFQSKESQRKTDSACIRCAKCVSVCPMGLEPYLLNRLSQRMMFENMEHEHVLDCMECGSCSFECPANLPLLDYIRLGKAEVNKIIRSRKN